MRGENDGFSLYHKTNKEALTVLCSVVKRTGSGDSTQEVGRNTRLLLVFSPTLLSWYRRFLRALKQNRAQSRLLCLLNKFIVAESITENFYHVAILFRPKCMRKKKQRGSAVCCLFYK